MKKKMDALKQKIDGNPALSKFKDIFDEENGDPDMVARLLDSPELLDMMIEITSRIGGHFPQHNREPMDLDEDDPQYKMNEAKTINEKWFKSNTPINIIHQMRHLFNAQSESRRNIALLVHDIVKDHYDLELSQQTCADIQLLSLNDEETNIVEIDYDALTHDILSEITVDTHYIVNNLLNNSTLNMNDCILTKYIQNKAFKNHNNMKNCSKQTLYDNDNRVLSGDRIKCGDIIHILSDSMYTAFSDIWYIVDTDNSTLQRIGIKKYGEYRQDPHVIIPGFVTQHLLDPLKAYSTFIHHHCWEDGSGVIEIELQIDKRSILFNSDETSKALCHHMNDKNARRLIASYGWKQKDWASKYTRNKHHIKEMENEYYHTIYIKTDAGMDGALIGYCNHPNVQKMNLSAICHQNADSEYVVKCNEQKEMSEKEVDQLLLSFDGNIRVKKVSKCLKRGIAFGVVAMDKEKGLDTVLLSGICHCEKPLICTIKDALYQPDYGGNDYCDRQNKGAAKCETQNCCNSYVTGICNGILRFDSGKSHNHCRRCKSMGECVGDYRNQHCYRCGDHYFAGSSGSFGCNNCDKCHDY